EEKKKEQEKGTGGKSFLNPEAYAATCNDAVSALVGCLSTEQEACGGGGEIITGDKVGETVDGSTSKAGDGCDNSSLCEKKLAPVAGGLGMPAPDGGGLAGLCKKKEKGGIPVIAQEWIIDWGPEGKPGGGPKGKPCDASVVCTEIMCPEGTQCVATPLTADTESRRGGHMPDPVAPKDYEARADINRDGILDLIRVRYPIMTKRPIGAPVKGKRTWFEVPALKTDVFVVRPDNPAQQEPLQMFAECAFNDWMERFQKNGWRVMGYPWIFSAREIPFCDQRDLQIKRCFSVGGEVSYAGRREVIRGFRVFIATNLLEGRFGSQQEDPTVTVSPVEAIFDGCRYVILSDLAPVGTER
ncbi:MAG: hypothetical protein HYV03_03445, partial [Deltaproteobacteria bacterium]|nr:hypothetical protein [Deltaproteobacteria bacterium]